MKIQFTEFGDNRSFGLFVRVYDESICEDLKNTVTHRLIDETELADLLYKFVDEIKLLQ